MKKIFAASAMVLTLSACGWDMDVGAWNRAVKLCEGHGGILAADHEVGNSVRARCVDGQQFFQRAATQ